jgi:hypothetical protein
MKAKEVEEDEEGEEEEEEEEEERKQNASGAFHVFSKLIPRQQYLKCSATSATNKHSNSPHSVIILPHHSKIISVCAS